MGGGPVYELCALASQSPTQFFPIVFFRISYKIFYAIRIFKLLTNFPNKGINRLMGAPNKTMRPKWARFIAEYIACGNAAMAARAVGYAHRSSSVVGKRLLKKPEIMAEIDRLRKEIMTEGKFNINKAMKEAEEGIAFAVKTENANAYATLVIHRAKLHGLVIDKADHRISGNFQLNIEGIDQVRQVGEAIVPTLITGGNKDGNGSNI